MIGNPLRYQHAKFGGKELILSKVMGWGVPQLYPPREPAITRVKWYYKLTIPIYVEIVEEGCAG